MHLTFQPHFIYTYTSPHPATPLVPLFSHHLHLQLWNTSASTSVLLLCSAHCQCYTWLPDKHLIIFQNSAQNSNYSTKSFMVTLLCTPTSIAYCTYYNQFPFYTAFLLYYTVSNLREEPHLITAHHLAQCFIHMGVH